MITFVAGPVPRYLVALFMMACLSVGQYVFAESAGKKIILESRVDSSAFYEGDYVIGVGDNVMVSVWRNPDLSITVPVRPDGKISTPLVGDIRAAGISPMQLSSALKKRLSKFIRDPQVSVIMTGLNSHEYVSRVRITGAVGGPTSVPHRMGMTVMDLILAAGGLSEFANGNRTVLYRMTAGNQETIKIKADDIWQKGKLDTNYLLRPGDVVSVPESLF